MNYLGIDESNHGRFPEIYVGVFSQAESEARRVKGGEEIAKKRGNTHSLFEILKNHDFRIITVESQVVELFGAHTARLIAYSEFLVHYSSTDELIVDGNLAETKKEQLAKMVGLRLMPRIRDIPKGDQKVPLLNMADAAANFLYRWYQKNGSLTHFTGRCLELRLDRYENYKSAMH